MMIKRKNSKKRSKKIALYLGRFQPMHKGHLEVIKRILKRHDELIIVIGSAQAKREHQNPLSAKERKDLVKKVLEGHNDVGTEKKISVKELKDTSSNQRWIKDLEKFSFDVIYTSNPLVEILSLKSSLKKNKDYEIINTKKLLGLSPKSKVSATQVRKLISQEKKLWKRKVPKEVIEYLEVKNLLPVIRRSEHELK